MVIPIKAIQERDKEIRIHREEVNLDAKIVTGHNIKNKFRGLK